MNLNSVHLGDCLELMSGIPDSSIDMVLCDLPFETTKCSWDIALDSKKLWSHYDRVAKKNAAIVLFAKSPFNIALGASNIENLRYEWIWEKTQATGFLNAKHSPMKAHENILVFYRKKPTYNPQMTSGHKPVNSYTKRSSVQNRTELYGKVSQDISGGGETVRFPRSVLLFSSDKQKNKSNGTIHPTQKPLALCEYLIKTYTNEGDTVLDNCAGSGTTLLAAKNTGRNFIGIEKEQKYYEICLKRLSL